MLPADLEIEANRKEAARILAPFLIISNHMVFNFDEADLKSSLMSAISVLIEATEFFDFSKLKENDHDDLEHAVASVMPQIFFNSCFPIKELKS